MADDKPTTVVSVSLEYEGPTPRCVYRFASQTPLELKGTVAIAFAEVLTNYTSAQLLLGDKLEACSIDLVLAILTGQLVPKNTPAGPILVPRSLPATVQAALERLLAKAREGVPASALGDAPLRCDDPNCVACHPRAGIPQC